MGIFDRFLLLLAILSLALLSLGGLLLALGILSLDYLGTSIAFLYRRVDVGLIALLFFLASVRLFVLALGSRRQMKSIVQRAELGEIRISLLAIENLVQKTVREVGGVRETRTRVNPGAEGIKVKVHAVMNPENHLPSISKEIQEVIRRRVRETIGVEVEEVAVFIDNLGTEVGAKVQ